MIDTVTEREIRALGQKDGLCISICIPTSPVGRDRMEGRVRLRNQIERAHEMLLEKGVRSTVAWDLLEPATQLLTDPDFWMGQSHGLAIYLADGLFRVIHLDEEPPEITVVGTHFHIRPLIDAAAETGVFVLSLDENRVSLYFARGEHIRELDVPEMPRTLKEAIGPEYSEKQRQMHSVGPASRQGAVSHGAGDRAADQKDRELRFCQAVDRAVAHYLSRSRVPLVLAADGPLADIYRHANHYSNLSSDGIEGSPARKPIRELAHSALELQRRHRRESERQWTKEFEERLALGKAELDPAKLLAEASAGRVDILLARRTALKWAVVQGRAEPNLVTSPMAGAEDLINLAEIETLQHGGKIVELHGEAPLPEAAALLRY